MPFYRRPKISVEAPEAIVGRPFRATVFLRTRVPLELAALRVTIEGRETLYTTGLSRRLFHDVHGLSGPVTLGPGMHAFPLDLTLPSGLPPSTVGRGAATEYELRVHGELVGGQEIDRSFGLTVASPPPAEQPGPRVPFATPVDGIAWATGRISGNLGGSVFFPGGTIAGEITIATSYTGYFHDMTVTLVQVETYEKEQGSRVEARFPVASTSLALVSGLPTEFRLELPAWITPTARSPSWALAWAVEIAFDAQHRVCRLPIAIARVADAPAARRVHARSFVSAELGAIWQQVARDIGMVLEGGVLVGRARAVNVRIHRERRDGEGLRLVALLGYPPLGLDLTIARPGRRDPARAAIDLGRTGWDQAHRAHARDVGQAFAYLSRLEGPLKSLWLHEMTDERLVAEQRFWVQERYALGHFGSRVLELARAIDVAFDDMPAPTELAPHVAAWKEITLALDGTLDVARMAVIGRYRGNEVEVRTRFGPGGMPSGTRLLFRPPHGIAPSRAGELALGMSGLAGVALDASLREGAIVVELPPVVADPASLLPVLHLLDGIGGMLATEAIPYR